MSTEIVAFEDERSEPSPCSDINEAFKPICYRAQGSCSMEEGVRAFDLLKLRKNWNIPFQFNLTGGDYHTKRFLESKKGHRYLTMSYPDLAYLKDVVKKIKEPSVLLIRGCELFLKLNFSFEIYKTLTTLEISGCNNVTNFPENTIAEMTQLRSLILSHLPIKPLPDGFFSNLTNLSTLILNSCSNINTLPKFVQLNQLSYLQLSHLPIETLPEEFSNLRKLARVIISGCSKLSFLPSIENMGQLELLDLSHCTTLEKMGYMPYWEKQLKKLDLSYTALPRLPTYNINAYYLTDLYLRDVRIDEVHLYRFPALKVLDLSGAKSARLVVQQNGSKLASLDLSRTDIESIDIIIYMTQLRHLILQECTRLIKLPTMKELTNLEVLDISGCQVLSCLPKDLSKLTSLKVFDLSRCVGLYELREGIFDQMSCLKSLDLSETKLTSLPSFANLINLRTLFLSQTSLDKVRGLSNLINLRVEIVDEIDLKVVEDSPKRLQGNTSMSNEVHLVSTFITKSGFDRFKYQITKLNDLISNIQSMNLNTHLKSQLQRMPADVKYILERIDLLESSPNSTNIEELLNRLMDLATVQNAGQVEAQLIQIVVKLKLLVPRKPMEKEEDLSNQFRLNKNHLVIVNDIDMNTPEMQNLLNSYESLTNIQRNCLLYYTLLPWVRYSNIKENMFISLLYAEGFTYGSKFMEIGQDIFKVLKEKGFIYGSRPDYMMMPAVHSFVLTRAKEERFFDFDCKMLTPHLSGSTRACLLKSQDNVPSSSTVWMNYINSPEKLQNIRTLLNINDPVIDIKVEWFSKMKNLYVLVLGVLGFPNEAENDIVDLKFLEELKNMKQLRLLSLQGVAAIRRLPDSVCELTNLKILNLSDCNLEELPHGIGSLKNLTYLDLTHCHNLSMLPKGLRLLSKLEVLKGFVISYQVGGQQHTKACTLSHLLKLENLIKFSLVVNKDKFPETKDLQVFAKMRKLSNLKITWQKNFNNDQQAPIQGSSHYSRWKMLKCRKPKTCQNNDTEPLGSYPFYNLDKFVLCGFPSETVPDWLHPSGMRNLERLYILGGNLKTFSQNTEIASWNVKTIKLRYLQNLDMDWEELRRIFSTRTCCWKYECDNLRNFPPKHWKPVWTIEDEESSETDSS